MNATFSRAELLSKGAKGGAALLVAGSAVTVIAPSAAAEPLSDGDLAFARLLVGSELLAIDFYARAIDAKKFAAREQKYLRAALRNEQEHYQSVAGILSGSGLVPAVAADFDFVYPKSAFSSRTSIARLAAELESTFLGAYLGAVGGMRATSLLSGIGSIAANEAQHLSVFQNILFGKPINLSFPPPLGMQQVSDVLDSYIS
jgi:hypothetical protein